MYTIKDLQQVLNIGHNTAYKLVKLKGFPTIKIGKKILVPEEGLIKWLKENTGNTINI